VVCLGAVSGIRREDGLAAALRAARQHDALIVLAHPHWCGNTLSDVHRWQFDGVEVYNHVCHWLNGKSNGLVHWEAALRRSPNTLAFASDDAHLRPEHPGWNGGWIVVNAPACTRSAILAAVRAGNYYSSCGPEIHSLSLQGDELHVAASPVRFARLVGPRNLGMRLGANGDQLLTQFCFPARRDWAYAYLELEDEAGRRAWTNTLFI
jgi:hypothetical protein